MLTKTRLCENGFVFYYQAQDNFSYQIIFSKKIKLNVVQKNKLKRQIRQAIKKLNYNKFKIFKD